MTHVPMLSTYVLEVLQSGGQIVHETNEEGVTMRLEDTNNQTLMSRVFAEASYLLTQGLARVTSEVNASATAQYQRVITAN